MQRRGGVLYVVREVGFFACLSPDVAERSARR